MKFCNIFSARAVSNENGCDLTPPTVHMCGVRYYYATRTSIHTYIYIARCQVVVKFYRDLYFLYRPANVPGSHASRDWMI